MASAHEHCNKCVRATCSLAAGCPMEPCPNCSVCLHVCKLEEHLKHICLEAVIPCLNSSGGCTKTLKRKKMSSHLSHCPAWVTQCKYFYSRTRLPTIETLDADIDSTLPDAKLLLDDLEFLHNQKAPNSDLCENQRQYFPSTETTSQIGLINFPSIKRDRTVQWALFKAGEKAYFDHSDLADRVRHYYFAPKEILPDHAIGCSQFIRRDEYNSHHQNHSDLVSDGYNMRIRRCPLHIYGCTYGTTQYSPSPRGSQLDYSSYAGSFVVRPLQTTTSCSGNSSYEAELIKKKELAQFGYDDWEGSLDYLGQLPVEVFMKIIDYLDSLSLWCLSQVNWHIRSVTHELVKKKGIVYKHWVKSNDKWQQGPAVRLQHCLYV